MLLFLASLHSLGPHCRWGGGPGSRKKKWLREILGRSHYLPTIANIQFRIVLSTKGPRHGFHAIHTPPASPSLHSCRDISTGNPHLHRSLNMRMESKSPVRSSSAGDGRTEEDGTMTTCNFGRLFCMTAVPSNKSNECVWCPFGEDSWWINWWLSASY